MTFEWSKYQKAIFEEVKNGKGNIVVQALAGSGKSSTLIESIKYLPNKNEKTLLCAFNKRIKEELEKRINNNDITCQTLHSIGFSAVRKAYPKVQLDSNKMDDVINSMRFNIPDADYSKVMKSLKQTISLSMALLQDVPSKISLLIDQYDIDYTPFGIEEFVDMVFRCIEKSKSIKNVINFDEMIYRPLIENLKMPIYDNIWADEFQDLNLNQYQLLLRCRGPKTRMFVFLDKFQGIYGFRGASGGEELETILNSLRAKELPLPICYRCPISVIELAKEFAPNIESFPGNKQGEVNHINYDLMYKTAKNGDYIISRYNAPLIKIYFSFIKNSKAINIVGRDIAQSLISTIKKTKCKTLSTFNSKLDEMEKTELAKARKEKRSSDMIVDKYECIRSIAENCKTVSEITSKINIIFTDDTDKGRILGGTCHKFKGEESENVYLINSTFSRSDQQESNLLYVAITRSKNKLYFVEKIKK